MLLPMKHLKQSARQMEGISKECAQATKEDVDGQ